MTYRSERCPALRSNIWPRVMLKGPACSAHKCTCGQRTTPPGQVPWKHLEARCTLVYIQGFSESYFQLYILCSNSGCKKRLLRIPFDIFHPLQECPADSQALILCSGSPVWSIPRSKFGETLAVVELLGCDSEALPPGMEDD